MKPEKNQFTPKEWSLIQRIRTPFQTQRFINAIPYNTEKKGDTLRSFRGVMNAKKAHCLEAHS